MRPWTEGYTPEEEADPRLPVVEAGVGFFGSELARFNFALTVANFPSTDESIMRQWLAERRVNKSFLFCCVEILGSGTLSREGH